MLRLVFCDVVIAVYGASFLYEKLFRYFKLFRMKSASVYINALVENTESCIKRQESINYYHCSSKVSFSTREYLLVSLTIKLLFRIPYNANLGNPN